MGLLDLIKREQFKSKVMIEAKEAEKMNELFEKDNKIKKDKYIQEGILYCPKCLATNLRPTKKKYKILNNGDGGKLTDFDGNIICDLSIRTIEIECLCCGNKWNSK